MPGLHFLHMASPSPETASRFSGSLPHLLHFDDYTAQTLYSDDLTAVACTRYQEYPVREMSIDRYRFFVEGYLYGSDLRRKLGELAGLLANSEGQTDRDSNLISRWTSSVDGDFVILTLDTVAHRWLLLNDSLARLPVYTQQTDTFFCATREFRLLSYLSPGSAFDRMGIAQTMLFGFPLGTRTILDRVQRLQGGSIVRISDGAATAEIEHGKPINLDDEDVGGGDGRAIARLVEQFITACRVRSTDRNPIIMGLSGGHDSRAVAAGLARAETSPKAYTWVPDGPEVPETRCARRVAEALGFSWTEVHTPPPSAAHADRIIQLKGGLVYTATAFGVPFLDRLRELDGPGTTYFSGDGGHESLPCLQPTMKFSSVDQLIRFLLQREATSDLDLASSLVGSTAGQLLEELDAVLSSYPEMDFGRKLVHFRIHERSRKWLYEGEDRNRSWFWCCTPFYGTPFFVDVMRVPQRRKRFHRFYRDFLKALSPAMTVIPDANRGLSLSSPWYSPRLRLITLLERNPELLNAVKRRLRRESGPTTPGLVGTVIRAQVDLCPDLSLYFDTDLLKRMVEPAANISPFVLHQVLTLTSAVELARRGETSLAGESQARL